MFRTARTGLLTLIVLGMTAVGYGQGPTLPKGTTPPGAAAVPVDRGQPIPGMNDVIATVTSRNQTSKITKGELLNLLRNYPLPAGEDPEFIYNQGVDMLVNTALLSHFLTRQNIAVSSTKIDEEIDKIQEQLKREGQDLPTFLRVTGTSLDEIRKKRENQIRWQDYVNLKGSEATLRRYLNDNRDRFSRTQVRASHILLKVDPKAGAPEKEKVKQKLIGIRNDILQNKLTFAEAANSIRLTPRTREAGGDLDWFLIEGMVVEEFAIPAFKLRKGEISQPVETPYGLHLIQVTDRKEGKLPEFEQYRPYIVSAYAADLQKEVVTAERKEAKIDVKPMPKDMFPALPPAAGPAGTTPVTAPAAAPKP